MVFVDPASPVETVTTTPAATAASLNCLVTSSAVTSGNGFEPKDSLITLTPVLTAYSMAWRKLDSVVKLKKLNTFSPTMLAPGATPSMRMLQADGSGWALKFCTL